MKSKEIIVKEIKATLDNLQKVNISNQLKAEVIYETLLRTFQSSYLILPPGDKNARR